MTTHQSIHDRIAARNREAAPTRGLAGLETAELEIAGLETTGLETAASETQGPAEAGRRWPRAAILSAAGLALMLAAGIYASRFPQVRALFQQGTATAAAASDAPLPDTPFANQAKEAGLSTCAPMYAALGQFLTEGARYNVVSEWAKDKPDEHGVQGYVGLDYEGQGYSGPAAGVVFAVPGARGCEGAMVRVTPVQQSCDNVLPTLPAGSELAATLNKVLFYRLANGGGEVLLLPSGNACVAISIGRQTSAAQDQS